MGAETESVLQGNGMMSIAEVLSGVWLFSGLERDQLENLAAFAFQKQFNPGEIVVEEGRTANGLYVIAVGRVEVVKGAHTPRPRVLATLAQGEFFGEMGLLDEMPRSATVRALEDTTCIGIDRWLFLAQIEKDPQTAIAMLQTMARRLRETDAQLAT